MNQQPAAIGAIFVSMQPDETIHGRTMVATNLLRRISGAMLWLTAAAGMAPAGEIYKSIDANGNKPPARRRFGGTATFALKQRNDHVIAEAKGKVRGDHPVYLGSNTDPLRQYPSYEIVTVNGISEAIEHRAMEPVFYITDDPAVLNRLGIAAPSTGVQR
jgi:hypothetical protein